MARTSRNSCSALRNLREPARLRRSPTMPPIRSRSTWPGKRKQFDLPLKASGTDFQKRVWRALEEIPYGQTRTYQEIACAIDSPRAMRAVGGANNKNPLPLLVPCHRVIGKNGDLVGYAAGLKIKQFLLDLEARNS